MTGGTVGFDGAHPDRQGHVTLGMGRQCTGQCRVEQIGSMICCNECGWNNKRPIAINNNTQDNGSDNRNTER